MYTKLEGEKNEFAPIYHRDKESIFQGKGLTEHMLKFGGVGTQVVYFVPWMFLKLALLKHLHRGIKWHMKSKL